MRRLVASLVGLAALVGAPLAVVALTGASSAAATCPAGTIVVSSNADSVVTGTLRAAIGTANGGSGAQTICIDTTLVTAPIVLASDLPSYDGTGTTTAPLFIQGNGATLNGNVHGAIVSTSSGLVTIDSLTITGANAITAGGGILASGALTLTNSTVTNNTGVAGGGILASGAVTLTNSTITNNTASADRGGGVFSDAAVTLTNSTITNNTAPDDGGGVWASGGVTLTNSTITNNTSSTDRGGGVFSDAAVTLTNSTISSNTASGDGGGVWASGGVTVTNSTISSNTAPGGGGGVFSEGAVTVTNSTVTNNTGTAVGGGVWGFGAVTVTLVYATVVQNSGGSSGGAGANVTTGGTLRSFGSVVAQPKGGGPNCSVASTTSNGFTFTDDASAAVSCMFNAATDQVGSSNDPMLGALGTNGGPTNTMVPNPGSPLIDAIPNAACQAGITTDQRSLPRPRPTGGACDIGAVEVQGAAPAALTLMPKLTG